jgi:hypothetical protein
MMEMEAISETLVLNSVLTWLIIKKDFSAFIHHKSFKSQTMKALCISGLGEMLAQSPGQF